MGNLFEGSKFYVLILSIFWKKGGDLGNYSKGDIILGRILIKEIGYLNFNSFLFDKNYLSPSNRVKS